MSNTLGSVSGEKEWGNLGAELKSFDGDQQAWAQARMLRSLVQTADRNNAEIIHSLDMLDMVAYAVDKFSSPAKKQNNRAETKVHQPLTAGRVMDIITTSVGVVGAVGLAVYFCGVFPSLPSGNSGSTQTPDNGHLDCGPFLAAATHYADKLNMNSGAVAAIDITHVDNITEMQPEIACFIPGLVKADIAWQGGSETLVSIVASDPEKEGALRPLIGIIDSSQANAEGKAPMLLANVANDGLRVERNSSGGIVIGVNEACNGCNHAVLELVAQDDSLQRFAILVNGEVLGGLAEETTLSADQVGQLSGGGNMLGIANALLEKEKKFQGQDQLTGIGPDIANVAGVGGNVGGEVKASFSPDSTALAAIKDQGLMLVSQNGEACIRSDSTLVDKVTMQIFDRNDPRIIYDLQLDDKGSAMVHVENGVNFVYYGQLVNGQFVARQKEVIGMIGAFGEQVECAGIIVKNPALVSAAVKGELNLQVGDKLFALMTKEGQVAAAVPAIVGIDDQVSLVQAGEGQVQMTVTSDEGTRVFNLQVSADLLKPPLPPLLELPQGTGEIQFVDGGYHYLNVELDKNVVVKIVEYTTTDGEAQRWITPADHLDWPLFIENEDGSWREAMVYVEVTKRLIGENGQETPFLGEDLIIHGDNDPSSVTFMSPVVVGKAYLGQEGYVRVPVAVSLDENPESPMIKFTLVLGHPESKIMVKSSGPSPNTRSLTRIEAAEKLETGVQIFVITHFDIIDKDAYQRDWNSDKSQFPEKIQDYFELSADNLWQNTTIISALRDRKFVDVLFKNLEIWFVRLIKSSDF